MLSWQEIGKESRRLEQTEFAKRNAAIPGNFWFIGGHNAKAANSERTINYKVNMSLSIRLE